LSSHFLKFELRNPVDGKIVIDNEQNSEERDGEIAYFIEELRQNKSLKELAILHGSNLSDGTLSNLILHVLVGGHPMLEKLRLYRSDGLDQSNQSTRSIRSLLYSGSCMLSELTFRAHTRFPLKINVGALAEAIVRYGGIQYLDLSHSSLDIRDFSTLLDAASRCRMLVTLDV
jgi:hypothetical protein